MHSTVATVKIQKRKRNRAMRLLIRKVSKPSMQAMRGDLMDEKSEGTETPHPS